MKKSYLIALFGLLLLMACNNQKKAETTIEAEAVIEEAVIDTIAEEADTVAIEAEEMLEE